MALTILTAVIVLGIVWGGFAALLVAALKYERRKR